MKAIPIVENIDAEFFSKETPNLVYLVNSLQHFDTLNSVKILNGIIYCLKLGKNKYG